MISGFLPIAKPKGPTSAAIVGKVRRLLKIKKVGHTGTLDPAATGVLLIAIQRATSLIQYLPTIKSYRATIRLGITTDTLDGEGELLKQQLVPALSQEQLQAVCAQFIGRIDQIPPMVSACQVKGQRLYKLARQGVTIERQPRQITIFELTLLDYQAPDLILDITCSAGTYIRTLADDIGRQLGCGAHLATLIRTKNSGIDLNQCLSLETLRDEVDQHSWQNHMIAPRAALQQLPVYQVPPEHEQAICHGQSVLLKTKLSEQSDQIHLIVSGQNQLLGLGYQEEMILKMKRVLWPE